MSPIRKTWKEYPLAKHKREAKDLIQFHNKSKDIEAFEKSKHFFTSQILNNAQFHTILNSVPFLNPLDLKNYPPKKIGRVQKNPLFPTNIKQPISQS